MRIVTFRAYNHSLSIPFRLSFSIHLLKDFFDIFILVVFYMHKFCRYDTKRYVNFYIFNNLGSVYMEVRDPRSVR